MSNIPKFDSKQFEKENMEIANIKSESEKNNKIHQLQNERKQIQDLEKGIEEENQREQMKKEEIRNEQLKDYSEFLRRKYDKNFIYFKNELPIKIGTENRKNLYEFHEDNSIIENNENYYKFQKENNLNKDNLDFNNLKIRQYSTINYDNNYNQFPNYINHYSHPLQIETYNNYDNDRYYYYLNNKYGKVYNILEKEKNYLKNKNYINPLNQSEIKSYHLPEKYFNTQSNIERKLEPYDDYININPLKNEIQNDLKIEKKQFEYKMPEYKDNNKNNNNNNSSNNNYNINNQNIYVQNNKEYKNNLNNMNLITKNNQNISQNMNNQNISNDENLIEIPKNNKPDFLDSRREYLYNKSHNTASIGNIITDPYSKKSINQISEYKKKIQKERDYKELLDEQIIYTNNNYRSLKRSYTNPNPYQAIREKKSPFYELPEDPYNLKIYNYNVISSLKNNPITNPVNSYLFKDKRKAYNGYFKNLGLNIIKK